MLLYFLLIYTKNYFIFFKVFVSNISKYFEFKYALYSQIKQKKKGFGFALQMKNIWKFPDYLHTGILASVSKLF